MSTLRLHEASKIGWILGVEENLVLAGGFKGYNKPLLGYIRDEKLPIYTSYIQYMDYDQLWPGDSIRDLLIPKFGGHES